MTNNTAIASLLVAGELSSAEAAIRERISFNEQDTAAWSFLAALLSRKDMHTDALSACARVLGLQPTNIDALFNQGISFARLDRHEEAIESFRRAFAVDPNKAPSPLIEAAASYIALRNTPGAVDVLSEINLVPQQIAADPEGIISRLGSTLAIRLLFVLRPIERGASMAALGKALWKDTSLRWSLSDFFPSLLHLVKDPSVGEIYLESLATGAPVIDFRPRFDKFTLATYNRKVASAAFAEDRARYCTLMDGKSRGATASHEQASVSAETLAASIVGLNGVTFSGRVCASRVGARYRFEYGSDQNQLASCTPWQLVPPPRTASFFQPVYLHRGEWLPSCTEPYWQWPKLRRGDGHLDAAFVAGARPALHFGNVFAKDRNQLNGIGSHEMPVGFAWCHDKATNLDAREPYGRPCASVSGGVQDMRDATFSFIVKGDVDQRGAAMHFWIARAEHDETSWFSSQWALTSAPFGDDALQNGAWFDVQFTLPNDPRSWTYTGNNPQEQKERAVRYRRNTLDTTLSQNNQPFVLIFAFGHERSPPTGNFAISSVSARYRDHSVLSPAFGAILKKSPEGSPSDPLVLTEGSRGFEDRFWVSGASPKLPAHFRWALKCPTRLTHFQINQHPYFPAKAVEVLGEDITGAQRILWTGDLPQARSDHDEPNFSEIYLDGEFTVTSVTLRVLSAYDTERWGFDGFEVFGVDAPFTPDGRPCSVSHDVDITPPESRIYYRLVLDQEGERKEGATLAIDRPGDEKPIIESAVPLIRKNNPPCYFVRANAMGKEAELWGELTLPTGEKFKSEPLYLGRQPTARHAHYFPGHLAQSQGTMRLFARNEAGTTSFEATWPIA